MSNKRRRWSWGRLLGRGVLGFLVLGALSAALFYFLTVRPDRQSVPYRQAMERLRANRSAARLLGAPIETGWWVRGHAGADSARFAVPVSGPRGEGLLHVKAQQAGGGWVFSRLTLAVADNNVRLSLLQKKRRREESEGDRPALEVPPRYQDQ